MIEEEDNSSDDVLKVCVVCAAALQLSYVQEYTPLAL